MSWGYGKRNEINLLGATSFGKNIHTTISFLIEGKNFKALQEASTITHNGIQEDISSISGINKLNHNLGIHFNFMVRDLKING